LEDALNCAGHNRPELEKVIEHYSKKTCDSLKLKATYFLIENMPGHYSYKNNVILNYYKEIDSILDSKEIKGIKKNKIEAIAKKYQGQLKEYIEDIKIISADYLIYNIDSAFELWNKPWTHHLSFEEFCESILPYKCTELQQMDYWRDSLSKKFTTMYDKDYDGEHISHPAMHYHFLMEEIRKKNR
jgi:hypothetical protein